MKNFSHMKIEMKIKDGQSNGLDFPLNFYGRDAPVKAVRALIEKFDITFGEIYLPLETAHLSQPVPGTTSQKSTEIVREN